MHLRRRTAGLVSQALRQMFERKIADEDYRAASDQVDERGQTDAWERIRRAMTKRISERHLTRYGIIHFILDPQGMAVPGRIVKRGWYRLGADIQDHARVINVVSETVEASLPAFATNSRRELRFSSVVITLVLHEGWVAVERPS
jgi:hypothetical protein